MVKAIVDPERCNPEFCEDGKCAIRKSCPTKAIYQLEAYEMPATDPDMCRGCSKCAIQCPLKAIRLV